MAKAKFYGTGRRKKSVARVYLVPGTGNITINKRDIDEYLGLETLKVVVRQPLVATETADKFDVIVNVKGGGYTGQAGAIRHGIARALLEADSEYRPVLKKAGYLTRDPRMKERKKYGLKSASSRSAVQQAIISVTQEIIFGTRICVQILVLQGICGVVRCGEKRWDLLGSQRICNTFATKISKKYRTLFGGRHWRVSIFCYADSASAITMSSFSKVLLIASTRTCISK